MTCRELDRFLMDYVAGELPSDTRAAFEGHLGVCPACVLYLEAYRKTMRLERDLAAAGEEVPASVPEDLVRAVLKATRGPGGGSDVAGGPPRGR